MNQNTELGQALARIRRVTSSNIHTFARVCFNFTPTPQQKELFDIIQAEMDLPYDERKKKVAVGSGQGPGKTSASVIIACFRAWRRDGAQVAVTAPTQRQCTRVFLGTLKKFLRKSPVWFRRLWAVDNTKALLCPKGGIDNWGILTITATHPENAQGIHDENLTVICEEASGIPRELQEQFEGTQTNPDSMWLQIGNPNSRDSYFFDCFTMQQHRWHTLNWNAEDTARDCPWLVDPKHLKELEEDYGRESDFYRVRVLGQFPSDDPNCMMGTEDLIRCSENNQADFMRQGLHIKQIGIDVGTSSGADEGVIVVRQGNAVLKLEGLAKKEPMELFERAVRLQQDFGWADDECVFVFDAGGVGRGGITAFERWGKTAYPFHFGGGSNDPECRYKGCEAWQWVSMQVKKHKIYLPRDNRLFQQLSTRQYTVEDHEGRGKIRLERKEHYKKRGPFDSPDRADAVVMAFYPLHREVVLTAGKSAGNTVGQSHRSYVE